METDADRLESIKALGGQLVSTLLGEVWALFDEEGVQVQFEGAQITSDSPTLTTTATDAKAFDLTTRGTKVTVKGVGFSVRSHQADGAGFMLITLDAE